MFDFESLSLKVQTEKEARTGNAFNAFKKADVVKTYIAFLSGTVNIDNQKIIESKMDQLIAEKIFDTEVFDNKTQFTQAMGVVKRLSEDAELRTWFQVNNNLIGFAVGIRDSFEYVKEIPVENFKELVRKFDDAFAAFDVSKIKLGQYRRRLANYFIGHLPVLADKAESELIEVLMMEVS